MKKIIIQLLLFYCGFTAAQGVNDFRWEIIGEMPFPVAGAKGVLFNERIYIIGGYSEEQKDFTAAIQEYEPFSGSWNIVDSMLVQRYGFSAVKYQDEFYLFGGAKKESSLYNLMEVWNPNLSSQLFDRNENFNRIYASSTDFFENIYIFGGYPDFKRKVSEEIPYIICYNLNSKEIVYQNDSLFSGEQLPIQQMAITLGDNIYIFGGVIFGISDKIFKFNIQSKEFQLINTKLIEARAAGESVKMHDGKVYIIGGYNEFDPAKSTVEIFEATWNFHFISYGPELNVARKEFTALLFNDYIYVFGGFGENGEVINSIERLYVGSATSVESGSDLIPKKIHLNHNYPNPFNPKTTITFALTTTSFVRLDIYSVLGEHIQTLNEKVLSPGYYHIEWDGKDLNGLPVPSGIYLYKLSGAGKIETKKMNLLR